MYNLCRYKKTQGVSEKDKKKKKKKGSLLGHVTAQWLNIEMELIFTSG